METRKRTLAKTATFRVTATLVTVILVFILTRNWILSGSIGVIDVISKTVVYYLHERAWDRVSWGTGD